MPGKTKQLLIYLCFMLLSITVSLFAVPEGVIIQGTLKDADGPLSGVREWRVQYYDVQTGGNPLGAPISGTMSLSESGRWSVNLTPPEEVMNTTGEVWYELAIDSATPPDGAIDPDDVFTDRKMVESVLFTRRSAKANQAQTASMAENSLTLNGMQPGEYITDSDLAAALALKAELDHTHYLHNLNGVYLELTDLPATPSSTQDRMYQENDILYFQGQDLTSGPGSGDYPDHVSFDSAMIGEDVTLLVDQKYTTPSMSTYFELSDYPFMAQSFTAGITGSLAKISLKLGAHDVPGKVVLSIWDGNDPRSGSARLSSFEFVEVQETITECEFVFSKPADVVANQEYYMLIEAMVRYDFTFGDDSYPEGRLWIFDSTSALQWDETLGVSADLWFRTWVCEKKDVLNMAGGSARISDTGTPPDDITERLYNNNGELYWNGIRLDIDSVTGIVSSGARYLLVESDAETTDSMRGRLLLDAYEHAKTMNPSADSRVIIILPPGKYDVTPGGLRMDTEYIDLVGMTTRRDAHYIYGEAPVCRGLIYQTADHVRLENLVVQNTPDDIQDFEVEWQDLPVAYQPNVVWNDGEEHFGSSPNTFIRNCEFRTPDFSHYNQVAQDYFATKWPSMGIFDLPPGGAIVTDYAGTYYNCLAEGAKSFGGGWMGIASGTFIDCTAGYGAFGHTGDASGTFINCEAGDYGFGGSEYGSYASGVFINCRGGFRSFAGGKNGRATGRFVDCTGEAFSFGSSDTSDSIASGEFIRCTGEASSFGGYECTASGYFMNCRGGEYSFGGFGGSATGVFVNCRADYNAFGGIFIDLDLGIKLPGTTEGGTFLYCEADEQSFADCSTTATLFKNCLSGIRCFGFENAAGTYINCIGGSDCFGGYELDSVASGIFINCVGGDNCFGGKGGGIASGEFINCIGGDSSFGGNSVFVSHDNQALASGKFTNCTGGYVSFGGGAGLASGVFKNCVGKDYSFGGHMEYSAGAYLSPNVGKAPGTFISCTGGYGSFGGHAGEASGTFIDCTGDEYAFGGHMTGLQKTNIGTASGTFKNCTGGNGSFGGNGGTAAGGTFYYCDGQGASSWAGDETTKIYCIKDGATY